MVSTRGIVKLLHESSANLWDNGGLTALMHASEYTGWMNNKEIGKLLLEFGMYTILQDKDRHTTMYIAMRSCESKIFTLEKRIMKLEEKIKKIRISTGKSGIFRSEESF